MRACLLLASLIVDVLCVVRNLQHERCEVLRLLDVYVCVSSLVRNEPLYYAW